MQPLLFFFASLLSSIKTTVSSTSAPRPSCVYVCLSGGGPAPHPIVVDSKERKIGDYPLFLGADSFPHPRTCCAFVSIFHPAPFFHSHHQANQTSGELAGFWGKAAGGKKKHLYGASDITDGVQSMINVRVWEKKKKKKEEEMTDCPRWIGVVSALPASVADTVAVRVQVAAAASPVAMVEEEGLGRDLGHGEILFLVIMTDGGSDAVLMEVVISEISFP